MPSVAQARSRFRLIRRSPEQVTRRALVCLGEVPDAVGMARNAVRTSEPADCVCVVTAIALGVAATRVHAGQLAMTTAAVGALGRVRVVA